MGYGRLLRKPNSLSIVFRLCLFAQLFLLGLAQVARGSAHERTPAVGRWGSSARAAILEVRLVKVAGRGSRLGNRRGLNRRVLTNLGRARGVHSSVGLTRTRLGRSEEHTSELQSRLE